MSTDRFIDVVRQKYNEGYQLKVQAFTAHIKSAILAAAEIGVTAADLYINKEESAFMDDAVRLFIQDNPEFRYLEYSAGGNNIFLFKWEV